MKLLVGLGNPEKEYAGTRHNVGFEVMKLAAESCGLSFRKMKYTSYYAEGVVKGEKVVIVLPQTYMNRSGESVRDFMRFYKLPPSDLIVAYDDISLPIGSIRIREKGSPGGHNGIKNILFHLETDEFTRIKVGIGGKPPGWDLADYVLSKFAPSEFDGIVSGVTKAVDALCHILEHGVVAAMNKYN